MPSLLDRSKGYAAFAVRRALGRSPDAKLAELETELRELKRTLAHQLRLFNGLSVNTFGNLVRLDHRQRIHFLSRDGTIVLSTVEGLPYAVDFGVNIEALELGCPDAFNVVSNGTDDVTADGCDTLTLAAGCGVAIEKTGAKEFTFRATGLAGASVNGVACEDECVTLAFEDDPCGICWDWSSSGGGEGCSITARLSLPALEAPPPGLPVYRKVCDCDGNAYAVAMYPIAP